MADILSWLIQAKGARGGRLVIGVLALGKLTVGPWKNHLPSPKNNRVEVLTYQRVLPGCDVNATPIRNLHLLVTSHEIYVIPIKIIMFC